MNYKMVFRLLGYVFIIVGGLMLLPLIITIIYAENTYLSFLIPAFVLIAGGILLSIIKPKKTEIFAKEGLVIVALSWIVMSIFGGLPFYISGEFPSFVDCMFESFSGFSTTGASILGSDGYMIEGISKSLLFWRSFTHLIGGMGVLVFVLAILPRTNIRSIHLFKAESPGYKVSKMVSKTKNTALVLYAIYIGLTILEFILLVISPKAGVFDSLCHAMGTAGTGGFSVFNGSIAQYNSVYIDIVITIFMILFGINFNIFFLLLIGNFRQVFKSEELRWYFGIIFFAIVVITISLMTQGVVDQVQNVVTKYNFGDALRYSSFQVATIISTTGYATADFNLWSQLCRIILVALMFCGASAGSTGGGIKVSRIVIATKYTASGLKSLCHPKAVSQVKFEGKVVDESSIKSIFNFFCCYAIIFLVSMLLISFDNFDFETNFTSIVACLSNIGPGLSGVGPMENFYAFSGLSKCVFSFCMVAGRLELFPIIALFMPSTWKKV